MNLVAFRTLSRGLQGNAGPMTTLARRAVETGRRSDVDQDEVRLAVERAWVAVAFHHWSAHAFLTEDGHVELQAAALDRPGGRYVSLHLLAQRAAPPALQLAAPADEHASAVRFVVDEEAAVALALPRP